jgi:cation diffusion facilitator CzcD-associated flavoprotein CzcO
MQPGTLSAMSQPIPISIAIIGSGFSGLGMAIRLKQEGIEDFVVLEREQDVGGTWWVNTYPGCQCDIPSHLYSFSFALNPDWSRTYPLQPEISDYLIDCSERYGIRPHVRFGCAVEGATWDEDEQCWVLETSDGELRAEVVIGGVGGLSEPSIPPIPGLERFEGPAFHSAQWNHEVELEGKRVAMIGTGASAIQIVPKIQPKVARLEVFQRTPPWVVPHNDRPITNVERRLFRRLPALQRLIRTAIYWARESLVIALARRPRLLRGLELVARAHMRRAVRDPELRRKLQPSYTIGCKRILPSNDYYPALTRPNVELVTEPIEEVTAGGIRTADGVEHPFDVIVLGTGFLVTEFPFAHRVQGRDGVLLCDAWDPSAQAYFGTAIAGFPNMFLMTGPNTGLGHNSMVFMIESQLNYVLDAIRTMERMGLTSVDVRPEMQDTYNAWLQENLAGTVWNTGGCSSWYLDKTGRNAVLWPDFTWRFRQRTRRFEPSEYQLRARAEQQQPVGA